MHLELIGTSKKMRIVTCYRNFNNFGKSGNSFCLDFNEAVKSDVRN